MQKANPPPPRDTLYSTRLIFLKCQCDYVLFLLNTFSFFTLFSELSNSLAWLTRLTSVSLLPTPPLTFSLEFHVPITLAFAYQSCNVPPSSCPSDIFCYFTHIRTWYDLIPIPLSALSINNTPKEGLLPLEPTRSCKLNSFHSMLNSPVVIVITVS